MKIPILCFRRWRAITYGVRQLAAAFIGRCFASAQNCAPDSAFLHSDVAVRPPVRHTLNPAKQSFAWPTRQQAAARHHPLLSGNCIRPLRKNADEAEHEKAKKRS